MTHIRTVRNSKMSIFQSLVEDVILRGRDEGAEHVRPTLDNPLVSAATHLSEFLHLGHEVPAEAPSEVEKLDGGGVAWTCIRLAFQLVEAKIEGDEAREKELEDDLKESTCDPGWVEAIVEYVEYFGVTGKKGNIPYVTYGNMDEFVLDRALPRNATVALLGDWGTGTLDAIRLLEQIAAKSPDALLHMGDVYYAGTEKEMHRNFLDICDRVFDRAAGRVPIYTLTGNHDMYSGGQGFYDVLSKLNPTPAFDPGQAQPASFFCLRSEGGSWQLLAMDTGLHDHDPFTVTTDITYLEESEAVWHRDKIDRFHDQGGKTILFSHHQLFSAFDMIGKASDKPENEKAYNPRLLETFRDVLPDKVAAWFWGHEHNLCIYEPYGPLDKGRCIGHGAIPVFEAQDPYKVDDELPAPRPQLVTNPDTGAPLELPLDSDGVYVHGYAILTLDDDNASATVDYYVDGDGDRPIYREVLS